MGKYITEALLTAGKHEITAITRADSTSTVPAGVEIRRVSYDDQASLVEALQGQDVLIITMGIRAPPEQQTKLIEAAATAKVPWVFPNEYGYDNSNPGLYKDIPIGPQHAKYREHIEKLGKSSWIGFTCSFWYEYSLSAGPAAYGFDLKNRAVTLFDDGNTHINTSTWPQCGRGMANLLALKVLPDDVQDKSPCLSHFKNKFVYISSFNVSQKDMLDSILRVTNTSVDEWKISHEPSSERYKAGVDALKQGDHIGFVKMMYSRVFYPDGSGNYESKNGVQNDILGLPKEDFDEYTKIALQMKPLYG